MSPIAGVWGRGVPAPRARLLPMPLPPEELLAAILMLTARSGAISTAIDIERLRATGQ